MFENLPSEVKIGGATIFILMSNNLLNFSIKYANII